MGIEDPLLIKHQPHSSIYMLKNLFDIEAEISHRSGIQSARVGYRNDTLSPYIYLPMTFDASDSKWKASLPNQQGFKITDYFYYFEATAISGKIQTRPMPAPQGYWKFSYGPGSIGNDKEKITLQPAFPNPSKGITCIPITLEKTQELKITLFDIHGKEVIQIFNGKGSYGKQNYFVNTKNITSGTYMIQVVSENNVQSQVLIVR
jgi:hypothetical protein